MTLSTFSTGLLFVYRVGWDLIWLLLLLSGWVKVFIAVLFVCPLFLCDDSPMSLYILTSPVGPVFKVYNVFWELEWRCSRRRWSAFELNIRAKRRTRDKTTAINSMIGWQSWETNSPQSNRLKTTVWITLRASNWTSKKMEARAHVQMLTIQ